MRVNESLYGTDPERQSSDMKKIYALLGTAMVLLCGCAGQVDQGATASAKSQQPGCAKAAMVSGMYRDVLCRSSLPMQLGKRSLQQR